MNTTKIHINLKQGILEAEGSEEFVTRIYSDFKENIKAGHFDSAPVTDQPANVKAVKTKPKSPPRRPLLKK